MMNKKTHDCGYNIAGILNVHFFREIMEDLPPERDFKKAVDKIVSDFADMAREWPYDDIAEERGLKARGSMDCTTEYARDLAGELTSEFVESMKVSKPKDVVTFKEDLIYFLSENLRELDLDAAMS